MRRNYTAAFVTGPAPQPLDAEATGGNAILSASGDMVVKLRLTRRVVSEGYREIILSVNPDTKLIRRIEGTPISGTAIRFDFININVNQDIPDLRFLYDSPASANIIPNFMFSDSE
jgi:outer membrane lipoprotein-sorting protein